LALHVRRTERFVTTKVGKLKAGAGLFTKGEGISRGSRFKPTAKNTTKAAKAMSGNKELFHALPDKASPAVRSACWLVLRR
jgi:hypothetical protein